MREHFNVLEFNLSMSLLFRYNYDKGWTLRSDASFVRITADDRNYAFSEDPARYERALKMKNDLMVFTGMVEFYPFWRYCPYFQSRFASVTRLHPYLATGLSLIINDLEFEDQNPADGIQKPVREGMTIGIPFEVGVKYFIHPDFNMGLSLSMNRAFSDRLDGYEFTEDEDWYTFAGLVVTFRID